MRANESNESWGLCPPGELAHLAARLDAHRRMRQSKSVIGRGVGLLVLVAAGLLALGAWTDLSCDRCRMHFAEYHDHLNGDRPMPDASLAGRVAEHLAHCNHCRQGFLAAYPDATLESASRPESPAELLCLKNRLWEASPTPITVTTATCCGPAARDRG